ncbi:DUF2993 domain-containing protein [Nocardia cyriacigeorgica]|uniref:DUF2993 domain-containing protein n=1 Tax=Nocardia cyriacigeorgica TaxID=135487 RepID=A0A6P1D1P0_9NOCA|nr:DUF2993 domain-containing protein [Nocardia cyriacigeorgica]NEW39524.1 DUF2993 domain-containing protein [Nocardia cyriacigeorgica]NEW43938.1 DUF2993 domain-containing protein [Nocardia cyriacigeorgica]NEW50013.1 DUF2993 domain-containing protein [Nocardia cyriacigeorgica]NEW56486.1 DUF2993 domain-containing protein [Nocardia cyriacigeorgica]
MPTKIRSALTVSRRTLVIALIAVTALLATVLVGGEAYARHAVSSCVSSQFEKEMGSKIDVGFGVKPMLVTWVDGKLPEVNVNSDDVKFGPAVGMRVHAKFHDIEVTDNGRGGAAIGRSTADVTWSNDGIRRTLGGLVSDVSSSSADGKLTMDVLGGLAQVAVQPRIADGTVQVDIESAHVLGIGLPTDLVQDIADLLSQSLQVYPFEMQPTGLEVTDDGLRVQLAGGPAELPAGNEGSSSC